MKVGCFSNVEHGQSFEYQLKKISELGFKCADIAESHSYGFLGSTYDFVPAVSLDDNPFNIMRLFEKYGLELYDVCAHSNLLDPVNPAIFQTNEIMKAIKFAAALDLKYVITTEGEPKTKWGKSLSRNEALLVICDKLYEPLNMAKDYGINVLLEPHGPLTDSIDGLQAIIEKLGDPDNLKICLDTGNSWIGGADPVEMAKTFKERIQHIHWKDYPKEYEEMRGKVFGTGRAPMAIGDGIIDIESVFNILKDSKLIKHSTLEVGGEENLKRSYAYLKSLGAE
jgi:inosose dehydratase